MKCWRKVGTNIGTHGEYKNYTLKRLISSVYMSQKILHIFRISGHAASKCLIKTPSAFQITQGQLDFPSNWKRYDKCLFVCLSRKNNQMFSLSESIESLRTPTTAIQLTSQLSINKVKLNLVIIYNKLDCKNKDLLQRLINFPSERSTHEVGFRFDLSERSRIWSGFKRRLQSGIICATGAWHGWLSGVAGGN